MRILLVTSTIPDPGRQASHIVLNATIEQIRRHGHTGIYQRIVRDRGTLTVEDERQMKRLAESGVEVLPLLAASDSTKPLPRGLAGRLRRHLATKPADLYPEVLLKEELERRAKAAGADVLFIFWNPEGLAASYGIRSVPKFVYYGMPDNAAGEARFNHPELFDIPHRRPGQKLRLAAYKRENAKRLKFHLQFLQECRTISNLSAFHAEWYKKLGHPRSLYIPNMWPDTRRKEGGRAPDSSMLPYKLLGSVGNVFATGNTFGLHYFGTQVLSLLRKKLGEGTFEFHIYGRGKAYGSVREALRAPEIKWRGWVPDLDEEIRSCHLFLIMNNAGEYRGAHTRFLHAWSLNACVVAHAANTICMPEIVHGENALLGNDAEEISDWVVKALADRHLRCKIGEGGRRTHQRYFTPEMVVPKMLTELTRCVSGTSVSPPDVQSAESVLSLR